jgi:hypothetical protein
MRHDQPGVVMTQRKAFRLFVSAVLAFSDDPGPDNLERYLAASRALEESRCSRQTRARARARTEASNATVRRTGRPVDVSTAKGEA